MTRPGHEQPFPFPLRSVKEESQPVILEGWVVSVRFLPGLPPLTAATRGRSGASRGAGEKEQQVLPLRKNQARVLVENVTKS